jgi:L-amino acid N-acyltransferase YncA
MSTQLTATSIRPAETTDAPAIASIYNHYVATTTITFEEQPVSDEQMAERVLEVQAASLPWLVAEDAGGILGYAYASKWKARSAYRFAVETSVYLRGGAIRSGLGSRLYEALFETLKVKGIHVVIGGIALPNDPSISLHEKFGMKKVAHFEQVGFKFGKWLDVGYWQKVL